MDENAKPAGRMIELPEKTREFLAQLDDQDIVTLNQGLGLIRSLMTVGRFTKWVIITIVGMFLGMVMVGEGVQKVLSWWPHK